MKLKATQFGLVQFLPIITKITIWKKSLKKYKRIEFGLDLFGKLADDEFINGHEKYYQYFSHPQHT